jgi:GDP-L-fucose synthase
VTDVVHAILDVLDFHPPVVYNSTKPSVIPYKVSDPGRAKALLGWEARTSLEEGLRKTIDWYVKNIHAAAPGSAEIVR